MARQYGGAPAPRGGGGWRRRALRPAGVLAWFDRDCPMCDQPIVARVHQVTDRKGTWIHTHCAPGQSDE